MVVYYAILQWRPSCPHFNLRNVMDVYQKTLRLTLNNSEWYDCIDEDITKIRIREGEYIL